jgi:hypothetical protein
MTVDRGFFDAVVVVSLCRRADRLAEFRAEIQKCGWPFREPAVFPAVDGSHLPLVPGYKNPAIWGCTQSHLRVLEEALNADCQRLWRELERRYANSLGQSATLQVVGPHE